MQQIRFLLISIFISLSLPAQVPVDSILERDVKSAIEFLASDLLMGRANGSAGIIKAAVFVGEKFKSAGLQPLPGQAGYFIPFRLTNEKKQLPPVILEWNDEVLEPARFLYIRQHPGYHQPLSLADFTLIEFDSCITENILSDYATHSGNILLWTSKKQTDSSQFFPAIIKMPAGGLHQDFLIVCTDKKPDSLTLSAVPGYYQKTGYNVAGLLPGKTKSDEVVVFSAHYDHVGIVNGFNLKDTIMNGANDDASGTTAVLALAEYFAMRGDNERTLLFCAFAGEELGLVGSRNFMQFINAEKIVANINIEMIGVPQYGKGTVFITGSHESRLPSYLYKGLKAAGLKVRNEPEPDKMLYRRSDNYSFALQGIPAHTIMSSDDDDDCYHRECDELKRINIVHMTKVIRGIALAAEEIINKKVKLK
ncbi:MAG TPA: M28 family peptidase [Chitinophagaceae bacterium]|nr:M28 family peptidase [Chitinophagaceae bacterium]